MISNARISNVNTTASAPELYLSTIDPPRDKLEAERRASCRRIQEMHAQSLNGAFTRNENKSFHTEYMDHGMNLSNSVSGSDDDVSNRRILDSLVTALGKATSDRDDDPFEPVPLPPNDVMEDLELTFDY